VPIVEEHEIVVSRVLTDRATEFCGKPEHHQYELYLAIENIDHTRTKARSPLLRMRLVKDWLGVHYHRFSRLEELSASRGG
jgi:hypothetical protein